MITYGQAIVLGALQGVTELFPISSLGHSALLPAIFRWNIDQQNNLFLVFLVATHLATALVLLGFFLKDWLLILRGIGRSLQNRKISETDTYAKLGWLIVASSVPAGVLGLLFEEKFKALLAFPRLVALFLILNGFLLYGAELLRKKTAARQAGDAVHDDQQIAGMTWLQGVEIGFAQCLALIPGFSRTGSTIGGGLLVGLSHEDAARFSFLLATPIIIAASVLKLPDLLGSGAAITGPIVAGSLAAALAAYFSIRFLTRYFETESKKLSPFALYCIVAGIAAILLI